jgi:hypothetical protein
MAIANNHKRRFGGTMLEERLQRIHLPQFLSLNKE